MTQDTHAGAGAQPAPAIQPVYLPLQQECADYATSLRSTTMQVKLEGRPEPQSMVRAADLFERAATRITQLDASASQLIEERDHAQDMADRLAQAISEEFRVDVGEHSNLNCPWHQALAVLNGEYTTDSDKDRCIAVQAGELAAARAEAKHWRSNHDNVVARLRIFTQRPDIPKELADRLPWYRELVRLQEVEAQALQQSAEITDAEIDRIAESMPGGLDGFLKAWGWRQFARAILQAAPPAPAAGAVPSDAQAPEQWIDDPHDIEQGRMLNPEWVRAQEHAPAAAAQEHATQLARGNSARSSQLPNYAPACRKALMNSVRATSP